MRRAAPMRRSDIESMPAGHEMDRLIAQHVLGCTPRLVTPIRFQLWGNDAADRKYWACGCSTYENNHLLHSDCHDDTHPSPGMLACYSTVDWYSLSVLDEMHKRGYAWTAKRYRPAMTLPGDDAGPAYRVSIYDTTATHDGYADSLAHAVCRAALIAVMELDEEDAEGQ